MKTTGDIAPNAKVQLAATNLAAGENASGIHWDDEARSVTFSYQGRGGKRTVWIANSFSAAFRLDTGAAVQPRRRRRSTTSRRRAVAPTSGRPSQQLSDAGILTLSRPNGELLTPTWSTGDGSHEPAGRRHT